MLLAASYRRWNERQAQCVVKAPGAGKPDSGKPAGTSKAQLPSVRSQIGVDPIEPSRNPITHGVDLTFPGLRLLGVTPATEATPPKEASGFSDRPPLKVTWGCVD